jgi:hypothetical protein
MKQDIDLRMSKISLPANLLGAVVTFGYFRYVDPVALTGVPRLGLGEILYVIVSFSALLPWATGWATGGRGP